MVDVSERTRELGTENAFVVLKEVNELLSQGRDIVNFCIGQPDFDTPEYIRSNQSDQRRKDRVHAFSRHTAAQRSCSQVSLWDEEH